MKKLLFVGDPHIKISNLGIAKEFFELLARKAEELKPDAVLLAGDLFDNHSIIRSEVLNAWIDYFEDTRIPHIALVGNHDMVGGESPLHALTAFQKSINVVSVPVQMGTLAFLPYAHSAEAFNEMLAQVDSSAEVLFCHQTFDGAQYDNGFYAPDGVSLSCVARFKKVISGHIHKRQSFANVWYPGTPFSHSFNDAGEQKCIWLIDMQSLDARPHDLGLPAHHTWDVDVAGATALVKNIVDTNMGHHFHKLTIRGSRVEVSALQDSAEFRAHRKQIQSLVVCPEYVDIVASVERISDAVSPEQMLHTYVSDIMRTDLDRTRVLEIATKILRGEET